MIAWMKGAALLLTLCTSAGLAKSCVRMILLSSGMALMMLFGPFRAIW